ncbi:putative spc97 / Spc98 family proteim [Lyophyllum shimeji]|uniref:Spc97 / Spc98 family proteim n=1 Tax=Lyophyllum shimeji TaxID=47721 RepID=A0A9P3UKA1_LYOSH|nr:putative spc97 / Spc98 family proteim [Lyophyllum shimeji]
MNSQADTIAPALHFTYTSAQQGMRAAVWNQRRPALASPPPSSASSRPLSRLSARSHARHARSRLVPLAQALVRQVTGLDDSSDADAAVASDFREAVDFVVKNLEGTTVSKGAVGVDMKVINRRIRGYALKARLNLQDEVGDALETRYQDLKANMERGHDLDQEITASHLPDHLQFLINLSNPPTPLTQHHASSILRRRAHPPSPPPVLTWASIVAEEPFEGEHWEGVYGLPPGFVRRDESQPKGFYDREKESERLDWDSRWSTPSLSPLNSDDLELDADQEEEKRARGYFDDSESSPDEDEDKEEDASGRQAAVYGESAPGSVPPHTYAHRREFEALQAKQYWREGWKEGVDPLGRREFDMGDASTLGPALRRILKTAEDVNGFLPGSLEALVQNERYINEEDAVREILMALQGRKNIMLECNASRDDHPGGIFITTKSTPRLLHLSLDAQASILASLAATATTVQRLRHFVLSVFAEVQTQHQPRHPARAEKSNTRTTRTREAFADAVDQEIRLFDAWCAAREEAMCRAWGGSGPSSSPLSSSPPADAVEGGDKLTISLLGTEKAIYDTFEGTFDVLLSIVRAVYPSPASDSASTHASRHRSPAVVTAALLDQLFASVQAHLERREHTTGAALLRVFVRSAEPIWGMMGKWLRDGMGLGVAIGSGDTAGVWELDDEFFIEGSGLGLGMMGLGLLDPEFWREGYVLREGIVFEQGDANGSAGEGKRQKTIPLFLEHVAEPLLSAGKAVGLLRALGVPLSSITAAEGVCEWRPFKELVGLTSAASSVSVPGKEGGNMLFSVSIDTLSRMIYDRLLPRCNAADALLAHVLVEDCGLWSHLGSIEDLLLMRRGDAMSHFTDVLFAKMDAQQPWSDFHFLNTAFADVVGASSNGGAKEWIQTALVRLSYRGGKDKDRTIARTVKALDGLAVEYAVPFPLTYIFQPAALQGYGEVFVLLLQIRRAKGVLERILVRGEARGERLRGELKVFYAMRSRLSWFINTLLNFLTTYVIHAQVLKFHDAFREAKSLDEVVQLHDDHLDKLRGRCLLKPNTSSLHRAILSILDMALHFADFFVAFAGDTTTTHDVSRQSISMRRHRSRRQRYQRRNAIGFSQSLRDMQDTSDEDDDDDIDTADAPEPSFSNNTSASYAEEGFQTRMDKMTSELDGLVRFLRRGVESLAGGTGEAAPAYGVLAFALEDWDN